MNASREVFLIYLIAENAWYGTTEPQSFIVATSFYAGTYNILLAFFDGGENRSGKALKNIFSLGAI